MVRDSTQSVAQAETLFRWSAAFCALLAAILWVGPYLMRSDLYADDAAQHLFWMYRFIDPQLFPDDLSVLYFGDSSAAPWGYQALYYLLSRLMDLQTASESVAFVLVLLSAWLAWKLGTASGDELPELRGLFAVTAVLTLIPIKLTDLLTPLGLQRSFALMLMLLCLWALVARQYIWVGISWLAAALFYPVALVVLGLTGGVVFLSHIVRERRLPPAGLWNIALGAAALGITFLNMDPPPGIGPAVTGEEARHMAEYLPGGRLPMFGMGSVATWFADHHIALGWPRRVVLLLGAALVVVCCFARRSIPAAGWTMVGVGLGIWFVSRQMLFQLYLPNRYSRWTLACFAVLVFSAAAYVAFNLLWRNLRTEKARKTLSWIAAMGSIMLVLAFLFPSAREAQARPVDHDMQRAYDFMATLPKDTLVAAHPDLADFIPLRSRKSVLASTEISLPFHLGYYNQLKPRIEASLRAAYATNTQELDSALAPYGVDVMLTSAVIWDKPDYFAPFDQLTRSLRERGERLGYVLRIPPPDRVLFRSGDVYIVRINAGG